MNRRANFLNVKLAYPMKGDLEHMLHAVQVFINGLSILSGPGNVSDSFNGGKEKVVLIFCIFVIYIIHNI